jgi:hypothetical protein
MSTTTTTTTTTTEQKHQEAVAAVVRDYEQLGYKVLAAMPDVLRPYRPDIVLQKGDETVIIEVKTPSSRKANGLWSHLAQAVAEHPGWHFKIVAADTGEGDVLDMRTLPGPTEVSARLSVVERLLAVERLLDDHDKSVGPLVVPALLFAWALFEAAARLCMLGDDRDPIKPSTPIALLKNLVSLGHIDQDEFLKVRSIMERRNAAAHGILDVPVSEADVRFLVQLSTRLLDEPATEAAAKPPAPPRGA